MSLLKVSIIGSGNVAYHLTRFFIKSGVDVESICARNHKEGRRIARYCKIQFQSDISKLSTSSDIYIICVSDDKIGTVAIQLPKTILQKKIVAHTSGSKSIDELNPAKNKGVFYPLQTFTKGVRINSETIPICIKGSNEKIEEKLLLLASCISQSVHVFDDEQRAQIHLSAVMINNFVNHIIHRSEVLLEGKEIPASILQPLLKETIRKQAKIGSKYAQTGPAKRSDKKVIQKHLNQLEEKPEDKAIYDAISKSISKEYKNK